MMNGSSFNKKFNGNNQFRDNENHENRVNWEIRVPQVRVVKDEQQLGIMSTDAARRLAQDEGLDLVEVVPGARPPVCRIMDYGKFKYEQNIKKKELAKKQRESQTQLKELRLSPCIADHDVDTKISQAKRFLEEGYKVQLSLKFRGQRELAHKDQGFSVVTRMLEQLNSICVVEKAPKMEGNRILCFLAPKI